MGSTALVVVIVVVALGFDFTNGFHDSANAIATSISTKALTPRVALAMAAVFNVVGALISTKVATTVGGGHHRAADQRHAAGLVVVLAALHRRDRLEPRHLVPRPAVVVLARAHRRPRRRGARGVRDA